MRQKSRAIRSQVHDHLRSWTLGCDGPFCHHLTKLNGLSTKAAACACQFDRGNVDWCDCDGPLKGPSVDSSAAALQVLQMHHQKDKLPETAVDMTGQRVSGRVKFMFGARYCNYGAAQQPEVTLLTFHVYCSIEQHSLTL